MARMSEMTLEEFKKEVIDTAVRHHGIQIKLNKESALEYALEYVFEQARIRGEWAGSKGITE